MARGARVLILGAGVLGLAVAVPRVDAARDLGVDLSHFQGETGMPQANWNQLAAEGRTFAFIKATEGLLPPGNIDPAWPTTVWALLLAQLNLGSGVFEYSVLDPAWPTNVQRATSAGILNGVYHFARPDNRPNVAGAVAEADHFVNTAGAAMGFGHLRPVLDLEVKASTQTGTMLTDWVVAFNDEVVRLKGAQAEPIIYTGGGFANLLDSRVAAYDLWLAQQSNPADPTTANPNLANTGSFGNWAFWQYSGSGSAGGISPIDLDVVHTESQPLSAFVITPEPSGVLLVATGAAGLALVRRRRRCAVTAS